MKFLILSTAIVGAAVLAGCGGTDTTVNVNRSASNALSSATNTLANAANSVANSVSNMTNSSTASGVNDFLEDAAMGGMAEVEMGKVASTKATNPEVKKFAQMMVQDHTNANTELKALAAKKNVTLPTEVDSSTKSMLDEMKGKTGADFDKEYVDEMVADHEKDVAAFEKQSTSATDADVKAFAAKTLPTLKKHLEQIKAIQAKLK